MSERKKHGTHTRLGTFGDTLRDIIYGVRGVRHPARQGAQGQGHTHTRDASAGPRMGTPLGLGRPAGGRLVIYGYLPCPPGSNVIYGYLPLGYVCPPGSSALSTVIYGYLRLSTVTLRLAISEGTTTGSVGCHMALPLMPHPIALASWQRSMPSCSLSARYFSGISASLSVGTRHRKRCAA